MAKVINGVRSASEFALDFMRENPGFATQVITSQRLGCVVADRDAEVAERLHEIAQILREAGPDAALGAIERTYETLTGGRMPRLTGPTAALRIEQHAWMTFAVGSNQFNVRASEGSLHVMTLHGEPVAVRPLVSNKVAIDILPE